MIVDLEELVQALELVSQGFPCYLDNEGIMCTNQKDYEKNNKGVIKIPNPLGVQKEDYQEFAINWCRDNNLKYQ